MTSTCEQAVCVAFVFLLFLAEIVVFEYVGMVIVATEALSWPVAAVIILGAVGLVGWIVLLWTYLTTLCSDPGYVTDEAWEKHRKRLSVTGGGEAAFAEGGATDERGELALSDIKREYSPNTNQLCMKCNTRRPERAHHCSACNKCVRRMDHHCPWMGNCIGHTNQRHFIQFGAWLAALTLFYAIIFIVLFVMTSIRDDMEGTKTEVGFILCLIFALISLVLVCAGVGVASQQLQAVARNQTNVESNYKSKNPYDIGKKKNQRQVFGDNCLYWVFPLPFRTPPNDGFRFPVNNMIEEGDAGLTVKTTAQTSKDLP